MYTDTYILSTHTNNTQGIYYANGVALSADESFVLVVETSGVRILKHYLQGPKVCVGGGGHLCV